MKQMNVQWRLFFPQQLVHLDKALQGSDAGATADGLTASFTIMLLHIVSSGGVTIDYSGGTG
jgi:hypothetical protein